MCPDTSKAKDIRIYKSVNFPMSWKLEKIIMNNVFAADSLVFEKDKIWWLFTNIDLSSCEDCCSELSIFYSKIGPITNEWIAHRNNPVICDASKARNGGLIFENNKIYRVNQKVGFNIYGNEFELNEIVKLNESEFIENCLFNVKPNFFRKIYGTHHYHSNNTYTVIDFCKNEYL